MSYPKPAKGRAESVRGISFHGRGVALGNERRQPALWPPGPQRLTAGPLVLAAALVSCLEPTDQGRGHRTVVAHPAAATEQDPHGVGPIRPFRFHGLDVAFEPGQPQQFVSHGARRGVEEHVLRIGPDLANVVEQAGGDAQVPLVAFQASLAGQILGHFEAVPSQASRESVVVARRGGHRPVPGADLPILQGTFDQTAQRRGIDLTDQGHDPGMDAIGGTGAGRQQIQGVIHEVVGRGPGHDRDGSAVRFVAGAPVGQPEPLALQRPGEQAVEQAGAGDEAGHDGLAIAQFPDLVGLVRGVLVEGSEQDRAEAGQVGRGQSVHGGLLRSRFKRGWRWRSGA